VFKLVSRQRTAKFDQESRKKNKRKKTRPTTQARTFFLDSDKFHCAIAEGPASEADDEGNAKSDSERCMGRRGVAGVSLKVFV